MDKLLILVFIFSLASCEKKKNETGERPKFTPQVIEEIPPEQVDETVLKVVEEDEIREEINEESENPNFMIRKIKDKLKVSVNNKEAKIRFTFTDDLRFKTKLAGQLLLDKIQIGPPLYPYFIDLPAGTQRNIEFSQIKFPKNSMISISDEQTLKEELLYNELNINIY